MTLDVKKDRIMHRMSYGFGPMQAVKKWLSASGSMDAAGLAVLFFAGLCLAPGQAAAGASLVASVLPSARSVQVNTRATASATIINASGVVAENCGVRLADDSLPVDFAYRALARGAIPRSERNQPVNLPPDNPATAGVLENIQNFVLVLTPTEAFGTRRIEFEFFCANAAPAPVFPGISTLDLSSSADPVPDLIANTLTLTPDNPVLELSGDRNRDLFVASAINIGAEDDVVAFVNYPADLPITAAICETDPETAVCKSPPSTGAVIFSSEEGGINTFRVDLIATGEVFLDPANNRVGIDFASSNGLRAGASSLAVSAARDSVISVDTWRRGVFYPRGTFQNRCANPSVDDASQIQGRLLDETNWIRSFSNDLYLWYDEVTDVNPAGYETETYFGLMRTRAVTESGEQRDNFHFTQPTESYDRQSEGVAVSYGFEWTVGANNETRITLVREGTPADRAGLTRGYYILAVDGVRIRPGISTRERDVILDGLLPGREGEQHNFLVQAPNGSTGLSVTLPAVELEEESVTNVLAFEAGSSRIGYMNFLTFNEPAEFELRDAMRALQEVEVTDLILDLRYNGGGLAYIASQLSYMIAGAQTTGKVFSEARFNNKHRTHNPFTGAPLRPTPFYRTTFTGEILPTLNLNRVYVLTGEGTCSASELVINSLRGIDVEVVQIGGVTCGKPFGFYPTDNCGTTYFTIMLETVNAKGFGSYTSGFAPANAVAPGAVRLPGCLVADDLDRLLGDPTEARLAAALNYWATGRCPVAAKAFNYSGPEREFRDSLLPQQGRRRLEGMIYSMPEGLKAMQQGQK